MAGPTRGFLGRRRERDPRLPPGQYDVGRDWPVLTAEPTPRISPETWSKFDTHFAGVSVDTLLEAARPTAEAHFVMATSKTGYTTNLPIEDVTGGKAWLVWEFDGKPLPIEHGGPVRLLVPHLYFWKSAKWVTRLELMAEDRPGFWEQNGYHDRDDPWREQRYQGD